MTTNYWLSIDFDYFVREDPKFDWGHKESPLFRDAMWHMRALGFVAGGFDLKDLMDPNKWASPTPMAFVSALAEKGIIIADECEVLVSDSHCFGFPTFTVEDEPADVLLSFDAHHDLGYNLEKLRADHTRGVVHCDDWLAMLLDHYPSLEVEIIYPEWKKEWLYEWAFVENSQNDEDTPAWVVDAFERVNKQIWSPGAELSEGFVTKIHICRSGSWVPPWLDGLFGDLCASVARATINELETPYIDFEKCDPLEPRPFDWEEINRVGLEQKKAMDQVRQLNRERLDQSEDDLNCVS